jgi:DNA-binding transcriptional regulator YdaS (Cro superfamily)
MADLKTALQYVEGLLSELTSLDEEITRHDALAREAERSQGELRGTFQLGKIIELVGLNQRQFADVFGLREDLVSLWANGRRPMPIERIKQLRSTLELAVRVQSMPPQLGSAQTETTTEKEARHDY